jgi:hypothetical protein
MFRQLSAPAQQMQLRYMPTICIVVLAEMREQNQKRYLEETEVILLVRKLREAKTTLWDLSTEWEPLPEGITTDSWAIDVFH